MRTVLLVTLLALCATFLNAQTSAGAEPLTGDFWKTHDPSIAKQASTWYVFATGRAPAGGQIPIRCSEDLQYWRFCGQVFDAVPDWIRKDSPGTKDLWAPDVSYYRHEYRLYYAYSLFGKNTSEIAFATNQTLDPKSPDYKWIDKGLVLRSAASDDFNAIDPNFVLDAQGRSWLAFGSFWSGIKLRRLDENGKLSAEDTRLYSLASREKPVGAAAAKPGLPADWQAIEAPFIVRHDSYYYLFVSWDLCCRGARSTYRTMVGQSREITGPYVDASGKPMSQGGGTEVLGGNQVWAGPGGGSVLPGSPNDLFVFHAYDRETGLSALQVSGIKWSSGWPHLALGVAHSPAPSSMAYSSPWEGVPFKVDIPGVLSRSNIWLGQPNSRADQALPLGNGRLGIALWSADGLTAQLNRVDTLPRRLSPGQVSIPGLARLTAAKDYSGTLDLYNGTFREQGAGMTATAYVQPESDVLVIDVTGAEPSEAQTALIKLWPTRHPRTSAHGAMGLLSESWIDNQEPGASGRAFGSLAAITAEARNVTAAVLDPLTITLTFTPRPDGSFQVRVAAPHYDGSGKADAIAQRTLGIVGSPHSREAWWNALWQKAGVIKISSPDGSGEYMEALRNIYLFAAAASSASEYPGSQAGLADMFSSAKDIHRWDPAAFWHWNLRMQVAANLGAGLPELNEPYFRLYREALPGIEDWTVHHMAERRGACVPETMRFNGPGIEYETGTDWSAPVTALDCDANFKPYYNARTLSTGAEISLWIWQQYLATGDRNFLAENYPVMAASARFLLAYEKKGEDGLNHTSPSNAHETRWDVTDPTTDISARTALYQVMIEAAKTLDRDPELIQTLEKALPLIPPLPGSNGEVLRDSYATASPDRNVENIGLEPLWPYNLISDASPLFELAKRTYFRRPFPLNQDWSFDPIQAARLGLGAEVKDTLERLTKHYQTFVNGFANWGGAAGEFYIEQSGVAATALQESLVQDFDGLIRIAPAVPATWDVDGVVHIRGNGEVYVQVRGGVPTAVAVRCGANGELRVRNPWPGRPADILDVASGEKLVKAQVGPVITFQAASGSIYVLEKSDSTEGFTPVTGTPANSVKRLGPVQIGLPPR